MPACARSTPIPKDGRARPSSTSPAPASFRATAPSPNTRPISGTSNRVGCSDGTRALPAGRRVGPDRGPRMSLPPFPAGYRASGVLLHVTSLPSTYGIGDVGPSAIAWLDRLHEAGQSWWQALPLGPTGYGDSPYQAMSSFAGNPLLISPDWLLEDELLRASDYAGRSFSATAVDFEAVRPFKYALLETARRNFRAGAPTDLRPELEQFEQTQAHWLDDYALFRALKERYGGASYLQWPEELARRVPAALDQARRDVASQAEQVRFAQFLLFRQGA